MNLPGMPSLSLPSSPKLPKPIGMPKPIKVSPPKIAAVHVAKVGGGFKVQHMMTHGAQPVPFVFSDPKKMLTHLRRIQASQWREPERNEAPKIERDLNFGPTA